MQAPTKLLADRYRFKQSLDLGAKSIAWIAVDEQSKTEVVAAALPSARVAALMGVVGLRHPHLASICHVVPDPDAEVIPGGVRVRAAGIVVAELVHGPTLHQSLKQGPPSPRVSVSWWLGLCDAVRSMHQAGGAHGAISPRSVVVYPSAGRPPPVLTQLLAPSSGAYCAPERLQGRGPSAADDVWALHASLFAALTGSPPFKGDSKDQLVLSMASGRLQQLTEYGVHEPGLQVLLDKGLTADLARRRSDISELISALEEYLGQSERTVQIAGPPLHVPDAREWEEDAATVVQEEGQQAAALMGGATLPQPAPVHSLPPVAVEDEAPRDEQPREVGDEEDATTVMQHPPTEEIESALRAAAARRPREALPEPEADPFPSPMEMRIPQPLPFDEEATINDQPPIASEPPTAIMSREELAFPPPPRAATFDASPRPAPAPRQPPTPADIAAQRFIDSGYPPAISSFPPAIAAQPPQAAPNYMQAALPVDDVVVRKAGRGPLIVLFAILFLIAIAISVALFLNYKRAPIQRSSADSRPPATAKTHVPPEPQTAAPTGPATTAEQAPTAAPPATTGGTSAPSLAAAVSAATGAKGGPECVRAHFPPGSFTKEEKFEFLCKAGDLRSTNAHFQRRLAAASAGRVTPAMREWSSFGWYELAATAIVRTNCCGGAQPVELPKTSGDCPQLKDAVTATAKPPLAADDAAGRAKAIEEAILCLYNKGTPRPYAYRARPTASQRTAFEGFFRRSVR